MIWKGTMPNDSKDGGRTIGMSLVVIMVGHATLDPALTPRYGTPPKQLSLIGPIRPLSWRSLMRRNEFPPPT